MQLLREGVARIESSFEVVQNRLMTLERLQPRIEGQLDILVRMQQSMVRSLLLAQAPSSPRGKVPDKAYGSRRRTLNVYAICVEG